jgi:hypothetical protein
MSSKLMLFSYFERFVLLFDLEGYMWVGPIKGSDSEGVTMFIQKSSWYIVVIIMNYSFIGFESSEFL